MEAFQALWFSSVKGQRENVIFEAVEGLITGFREWEVKNPILDTALVEGFNLISDHTKAVKK